MVNLRLMQKVVCKGKMQLKGWPSDLFLANYIIQASWAPWWLPHCKRERFEFSNWQKNNLWRWLLRRQSKFYSLHWQEHGTDISMMRWSTFCINRKVWCLRDLTYTTGFQCLALRERIEWLILILRFSAWGIKVSIFKENWSESFSFSTSISAGLKIYHHIFI